MNYNEAHNYLNLEIGVDNGLKMMDLIAKNKINEGINFIQELTQCDDNTAQTLWIELKNKYGKNATKNLIKEQEYKKEQQNKPKCPTCQSTNLKKISVTSKVTNTALFGIFGTKRYKTFHCNNCGYEW